MVATVADMVMAMVDTACTVAMATGMAVTGVITVTVTSVVRSTSAEAAGARCGPTSGRAACTSAVGCSKFPAITRQQEGLSRRLGPLLLLTAHSLTAREGLHKTVQILAALKEGFDLNALVAAMRAIFCNVVREP